MKTKQHALDRLLDLLTDLEPDELDQLLEKLYGLARKK